MLKLANTVLILINPSPSNVIIITDLLDEIRIFFSAVTQLRSVDAHKGAVKSDRKIKEMEFNSEENKKNLDRMTELVDKLQGKIRTYKKQIEDAEEIAALNLAKFRKAQQQLEEAEERSKLAELNMARMRGDRFFIAANSTLLEH